MDLVVPLSNESAWGDLELRYLLRSVEANAPFVERVVVVSERLPEWCFGVELVECSDPFDSCKDANLFLKVVRALESGVSGEFCLCADDNAFLRESWGCPLLYNTRGLGFFSGCSGKWGMRMARTLELAKSRGLDTGRNYDVHAPQVFESGRVLSALSGLDWWTVPGYCLYSLFRIFDGRWGGGEPQDSLKVTAEAVEWGRPAVGEGMMYLGYNDRGWNSWCRDFLKRRFPYRSRYERD